MRIFLFFIRREIQLSLKYGTDSLGTILFFILIASLFPLALGPEPQLLRQIAPGILWVCVLLAALLPIERLFNHEYEDGSLEQLLLLGLPPYGVAFAKIVGHWLTTGMPLLIASVPLALMFNFPYHAIPLFLFSLMIGTGCLSLLGGMATCIALGARRSAFLLPLLTFPLLTPIIIFGAMITDAQLHALNFMPHLQLLGACFALALPLCPFVAGAGLKLAVE
ncbi:ABC-type transport system involved in cytochrome c biogenesis [Commensalibacter communis]|uniref:heme exporter protein CcmB n=1 Tax=Commensalibacter communis TaxID=2972786 RepID=UPI0022FF52AD|nr:heme exporter protein CcmB [Commensalibacter communis]CAI3939416.1 ABC-type transport system involved in cytochrome c biogenesis [Commensalibacter communis]